MQGKTIAPFGTWVSPISPESLGLGIRLEDVQFASSGEVLWLEGRSGKGVLVCQKEGAAPRDISGDLSVHGGVGYGGGDFCAGNGCAVFAEKDGRLFRVDFGAEVPRAITPAFGAAASPAISPDGRFILYVHSYEKTDRLALVDSEGRAWPRILVEGADFYMQPVWHPDGARIAWVEWNHPNMPWDGAALKSARFDPATISLTDQMTLVGGDDIPVFQPAFSPSGRYIACIVGEGEWDSLVLINPANGERSTLIEGAVLMEPAWEQGMRAFDWSADGKEIIYRRNDGGWMSLWAIDIASGTMRQLDTAPYTSIHQNGSAFSAGKLAFLASAPSIPTCVVEWKKGRMRTLAQSFSESMPPENYSSPQPFSWKAEDGEDIHGLYYPPAHPDYEGIDLPPAILSIHGGPTSQWEASYSSDVAFFTSRGFACLLVNYRGSSGYGRRYEHALRGRWGELDAGDAASGAKALCERGLADPRRLVIKGGSAGGFTVLQALIHFPGLFRAGVCLYGVSNLLTLASDTHKFEERYLDRLVGSLSESDLTYRERSPVFHADRIRDPLAIFQGAEDRVVPPAQSEEIVEALRRNGIACTYRLFPGEGHGWRKAETIVSYYTELEEFLRQRVLFA
jgi:dipeptidyl aminopeptidase/acylaminoacyl peptidase